MKTTRWGLILTGVCGLMLLASPAQAGLGAVLARARNRVVRFPILDKITGHEPRPLQPAGVAPPAAPENLHVVGRDGSSLQLAWEPAAPGPGRMIAHYEVRRNGVPIEQTAMPGATVTINPAGTALESFTVVAVDNQGGASLPSDAVVAVRGQPVPFEIQRRTAFVQVETGAGSAEAALAEATEQLATLEWGRVYGLGDGNPLLFSPLTAYLAVRLYEGEGSAHEEQMLSQGEYRIRIGASAPVGPGFPSGPMGNPRAELPVGAIVPVRWAEVFQPFDEGERVVMAVRSEDLLIATGGATGAGHFVPVPERAGFVALRLLPNFGEFQARPTAGNDTPGIAPDVLSAGQIADIELIDPVGSDYLTGAAGGPVVITVEGVPGVVRILAIDPELERVGGLDAAMAEGIEIPSGTDVLAYTTADGRTAGGRRLLVLGVSPGVARVAVTFWGLAGLSTARAITVLPRIELGMDADRDGFLVLRGENASDQVTAHEPFRFWVNDDDDEGEKDVSDISQGAVAAANFQNDVVDGARDLVDFFPVFVDVGEALRVLRDGPSVTVRLRQADGAVNFAYTNAGRDHATAHWKELPTNGYGDAFDRLPGAAETHRVTAEGAVLSTAFLDGVRDRGWGVLLVEGRSPSVAPLVLQVERNGLVVAETQLEMRLSNVEDMFRHVDLTKVPREYEGEEPVLPEEAMPDRKGDPGEAWPDAATNGKYFVFVHGYAVDAQRARGWQSEMFKRLHVLGSRARFVGVTWHGATGLHVGDGYLDYHKSVYNALQTGDALNDALKDLTKGAEVTVAAHSLGNGVVGQAIQYGSFRPTHYIMINAALAVEAYDPGSVSEAERRDMLESDWMPYDQRLNAGNWFRLFLNSSDERRKLTWQGRYEELAQLTDLHHFYSSGEEVLKNAEGVHVPSVLGWLSREQGGVIRGEGSWKMQELAKGLALNDSLGAVLLSRHQAGWSFELGWMVSSAGGHNTGVNSRLRTPDETKDISAEILKTQPFFGDFKEPALTSPQANAASIAAAEPRVLYDLLARAIPAKSHAAAANKVGSIGPRNYNMNTEGHPPEVLPLPTATGKWGHSDLKLLNLPLSHPMYSEIIERGALR